MKNWYERSIKALVEEYFNSNGFSITYDPSDFWDDAMKKWKKNIPDAQLIRFNRIASQARAHAFDKKYGAYSYSADYRSICENWNIIILNQIQRVVGENLSFKKVLAVGANNGSELAIIFGKYFTSMKIDVVEISEKACSLGKKLYPQISFKCASMDEVKIHDNNYDIFISLRAAYCAGNNLDLIVKKAISSVKAGGIILFSVSNGYIDTTDGKNIPITGVYNPENLHCDKAETERNINWMKSAMLQNGCINVDIIDAESEILLISKC